MDHILRERFLMSKVMQDYLNKIYTLVILVITGSTTCAGVTFLTLKAMGFYPDVSWTALGLFLASCLVYLIVGIIFIKTSYEKNSNGEKYIKPKMLKAGKIFVILLLLIQFNFISYMIPSREFWAYAFYFVILAAFFLDVKMILICVAEIFLSVLVSHLVNPDVLLPAKDELFVPEVVLRLICVVLSLFAISLMVIFVSRNLVNMKKNEIEENNARVNSVLSAARQLSERLLNAGAALSEISSNEAANADELASTSEALLQSSNSLSERASESISNLNELKDCGNLLSEKVEQVENTSQSLIEKSSENEQVLGSLQTVNKEVIESMNDTNAVAEKLSGAVRDIDATLNLISDIAMSTKVLSINATIEAARAGEAGKGFAVVAQEVGELAASTQSSLDEIQSVITRIQQNVKEMTDYVNSNFKKLSLQNEYFMDVFNNLNEMNLLLEQAMNDIKTMHDVHSRQSEVIRKTVDISESIANEIQIENHDFVNISSMVESNVSNASNMSGQVNEINSMVSQIDVLLKE